MLCVAIVHSFVLLSCIPFYRCKTIDSSIYLLMGCLDISQFLVITDKAVQVYKSFYGHMLLFLLVNT